MSNLKALINKPLLRRFCVFFVYHNLFTYECLWKYPHFTKKLRKCSLPTALNVGSVIVHLIRKTKMWRCHWRSWHVDITGSQTHSDFSTYTLLHHFWFESNSSVIRLIKITFLIPIILMIHVHDWARYLSWWWVCYGFFSLPVIPCLLVYQWRWHILLKKWRDSLLFSVNTK